MEHFTKRCNRTASTPSFGGIAGIFALLIPVNAKQNPGPPPDQPTNPLPDPTAVGFRPPLSGDSRIYAELDEWREYGQHISEYVERQDKARAQLDTKQTVLRISFYGIIGAALLVCIAGFLASPITVQPGLLGAESTSFVHLEYLLAAFSTVGFVLGAIVFRVAVITTAQHAARCALISSSVLTIGTMLLSLPYIFVRMWGQQITGFGLTMPMLVWMTGFRVFVAPAACWLFGRIGFYTAEFFSRPQAYSHLQND